jgi:hypothetical protein
LAERDCGQQDERREKRGDVDALLVVALVEIKKEGPEEEEEPAPVSMMARAQSSTPP